MSYTPMKVEPHRFLNVWFDLNCMSIEEICEELSPTMLKPQPRLVLDEPDDLARVTRDRQHDRPVYNLLQVSLAAEKVVINRWDTLQEWGSANPDNAYRLLGVLCDMAATQQNAIGCLMKHKSVCDWVMIQISSQNLLMNHKNHALDLLPFLTSPAEDINHELTTALKALKHQHFPHRSSELVKDSLEYIGFMLAFHKLLTGLEVTGSRVLLHAVVASSASDPHHICEDSIQRALKSFICRLQREDQLKAVEVPYQVFFSIDYDPVIRLGAVERFCRSMLLCCNEASVRQFLCSHVQALRELLDEKLSGASGMKYEHQLVGKIGVWMLMGVMFSRLDPQELESVDCPITRAAMTGPVTTGKELIVHITKGAFNARCENIPPALGSDSRVPDLFRRYQCTAYNTLVTIVSNTKRSAAELKFYQGFLFTENRDKNQLLWEKLVDCSRTYTFPMDWEEIPKRRKIMVGIRRMASQSGSTEVSYLPTHTQYLFDSTLREDVTQFDFTTSLVLSDGVTLPHYDVTESMEVTLESDSLNEHECMSTLCGLIQHMVQCGISPLPQDMNYFLIDIIAMLLSWCDVAIPQSSDVFASEILHFLIANVHHNRRDIFKHNLEVIKTLVEVWKPCLSIPKQQLLDGIVPKGGPDSRDTETGIQLVGVMLANNIHPWSETGKKLFLDKLLSNMDSTQREKVAGTFRVLCLEMILGRLVTIQQSVYLTLVDVGLMEYLRNRESDVQELALKIVSQVAPRIEPTQLALIFPESTHSSRPTVETSKQDKWWKVNANVTECETLWCIQTSIHHNSLRHAESSVKLFKRMFRDSSTATDMRLGKDKISYSIVALKEGLSGLDVHKIIQLSMDGPNVNMKLLQMLKIELAEDPHGPQMLDIGSCGLHVVNVALKTGIKKTSWTLLAFFRACYYLFKDSPSRRGTYMAVTGSSTFPMKFCSVRWLENVDVAKRALETLDNLKKFVEYISTHKNMKATASSASFKVISCSLKDKLLRPKLAFFLSLAEDLEPFLKEFQSDCPMSPFLHGNLLNILKTCMERVVKDNVLGSTLLQKVDLKKEENLKGARDIDIGYATRSALRKCQGIKDIDVLLFRQDCRTCLKNVVDKLLERSPLKFPLTEALTFLNPYKIGFNQDEAMQQMTSAMDILVTSNLIPASVAQNADREYKELVSQEKVCRFGSHGVPACRRVMYEIAMWVYTEFRQRIDESDVEMSLFEESKVILLRGLVDSDSALQETAFKFWNTDTHFPAGTAHRLVTLLTELYSPRTEPNFLAYSTQLLLEATALGPDFSRKIFDHPLSACKFEDLKVLVSWRAQHTSIAPMFAETFVSQNNTQAPGSLDMVVRATQTSLEFQPTLEQGEDVVDASNTSFSSFANSSFLFSVGSLGDKSRHARQRIRARRGNQQLDNSTEIVNSNPPSSYLRRRFLKDKEKIRIGFASNEVLRKRRREEHLKERAKKREATVNMYRSYRIGDLPDIEILHSALIRPLQVLAKRDSSIGRQLLVSLFSGILVEMGDGADWFTTRSAGALGDILSSSTLSCPPVIGTVLEIALANSQHINLDIESITTEDTSFQHEGRGFNEEESSHKDAEISPNALEDDEPFLGFEVNENPMLDIGERQDQGTASTESDMLTQRGPGRPKLMRTGRRGRPTKIYQPAANRADQNLALNNDPPYTSRSSGLLALGSLLLEQMLMKGDDEGQRPPKRARARTDTGQQLWLKLAELYGHLDEWDVVRGIFRDKVQCGDSVQEALLAEATGIWREARDLYQETLQETECLVHDYCYQALYKCLAHLSDWDKLNTNVRSQAADGDLDQLWKDTWCKEQVLPWLFSSEMQLKLSQVDPTGETVASWPFLATIQKWLDDEDKAHHLKMCLVHLLYPQILLAGIQDRHGGELVGSGWNIYGKKGGPVSDCSEPDKKGGPVSDCSEPDKKGGPVSDCIEPDKKGGPVSDCIEPDKKGCQAGDCSETGKKGGPVSDCIEPDKKGGPVSDCIEPDKKGCPAGDCSEPGKKGGPAGDCSEPDKKDGTVSDCIEPDKKGGPVSDCSEPYKKNAPMSDCSEPNKKGCPAGDCSEPDKKGCPAGDCSETGKKGGPAGDCSEPDKKDGPVSDCIEPDKKDGPVSDCIEPDKKNAPMSDCSEPDKKVVLEPGKKGGPAGDCSEPDNKDGPVSDCSEPDKKGCPVGDCSEPVNQIRKVVQQVIAVNQVRKVVQRVIAVNQDKKGGPYNYSYMLALMYTLKRDFELANHHAAQDLTLFLETWSHLSPLEDKLRTASMLDLQRAADMHVYLEFAGATNNARYQQNVTTLVDRWSHTLPCTTDSLLHWDKRMMARCGFIAQMKGRLIPMGQQSELLVQRIKNLQTEMELSLTDTALAQSNFYVARKFLERTKSKVAGGDTEQSVRWGLYFSRAKWLRAELDDEPANKLKWTLAAWMQLADDLLESKVVQNDSTLHIAIQQHQSVLAQGARHHISAAPHILADIDPVSLDGLAQRVSADSQSPETLIEGLKEFGLSCLLKATQLVKTDSLPQHQNTLVAETYLLLAQYCRSLVKCDDGNQSFVYDTHIVTSILRAMKHGSRQARQLFPCLLQISSIANITKDTFQKESSDVPEWMFLGWVSQLIASLDTPVGLALGDLILRLATSYPKAVIYPFYISSDKYKCKDGELAHHTRCLIDRLKGMLQTSSLQDTLLKAFSCVAQPPLILKYHLEILIKFLEDEVLSLNKLRSSFHDMMAEVFSSDTSSETKLHGSVFKTVMSFKDTLLKILGENCDKVNGRNVRSVIQALKEEKVKVTAVMDSYSKKIPKLLKDFCPWLEEFQGAKLNEELEIPGQYTGEQRPLPQFHVKILGFDSKSTHRGSFRACVILLPPDDHTLLTLFDWGFSNNDKWSQSTSLNFYSSRMCSEPPIPIYSLCDSSQICGAKHPWTSWPRAVSRLVPKKLQPPHPKGWDDTDQAGYPGSTGALKRLTARMLQAQNPRSLDPQARTPPLCQRHHSSAIKLNVPQSRTHLWAAAMSKHTPWAVGPALCTTYSESSQTEAYPSVGPPRAPVGYGKKKEENVVMNKMTSKGSQTNRNNVPGIKMEKGIRDIPSKTYGTFDNTLRLSRLYPIEPYLEQMEHVCEEYAGVPLVFTADANAKSPIGRSEGIEGMPRPSDNVEGGNQVLEGLDIWCKSVKLKMAPAKTTFMLFRGRLIRNPSIKINGKAIRRSHTVRYLGVTLDENRNFTTDMEEVPKVRRPFQLGIQGILVGHILTDPVMWKLLDAIASEVSDKVKNDYLTALNKARDRRPRLDRQELQNRTDDSDTGDDDPVLVMTSLRYPLRLTILGNDAKEHHYLVKFGEDLRQDQRIQQLLRLMNEILHNDAACHHHSLNISSGNKTKNIQPSERYATAYLKFNRDKTVTKFQELTNQLPWDIFRRGLSALSSSPEVFFSLRHNFVLSYATLCISHWFLGIGDRHLSNCLVSQKDARCVAIDFGHSFGTATQFLPVPELFPFRLTPHLVSMMQPLEQTGRVENHFVNTILSTPDRDSNLVPLIIGIYCESSALDHAATEAGFLRESMIHVVRALRKNHSILLATMEVFVLEPSIDWLEHARKQNKNIHASTSFRKVDEDSWFPRQKVSLARKKLEGANPAAITEEELQSGIMSSSVALKEILKVARGDAEHNKRARLPDTNLTPEKQVDCLLDQATDYHLLGMSWEVGILPTSPIGKVTASDVRDIPHCNQIGCLVVQHGSDTTQPAHSPVGVIGSDTTQPVHSTVGVNGSDTTQPAHSPVGVIGSDTTQPAHSPVGVIGSDTTQPAHSPVGVIGSDTTQPAHSPVSVIGSDTTQPAHSTVSVIGSDTTQPAHSRLCKSVLKVSSLMHLTLLRGRGSKCLHGVIWGDSGYLSVLGNTDLIFKPVHQSFKDR
uniref:PI3K/PI4K catalytic domain-containing protein n=1 Tax=Timema bartmani TaxID=61472 RepID=A0A7R9ES25_9NEOP|nr:unnamed protein product [Timema bartmani]